MCCLDHVLWLSKVSENLNGSQNSLMKKKQTNDTITTKSIPQRV